ncbi:FIST N-terminal domain-containing protein [Cytophaga sp. FL35]|uniref:FIST signal transduction protein n=1 Tax=Cytophaga sp. FL35 TaxID=1904456 RepID=UPI001653EB01|nr:FIST N-terminal domain-containing protein [Cytophaga sp. FL35]MBC6998896.1 FIST C-terminal domain-containing protein [Cytophaga sp. FL35]
MKIVQAKKTKGNPWEFSTDKSILKNPLVLVFGDRFLLEEENCFEEISQLFPDGHIVIGSTSGEILKENVFEKSMVLTAIEFEKSSYLVKSKNLADFNGDDELLGKTLMEEFPQKNLKHVFVVSEGSSVNGSSLIIGLELSKKANVGLSGGLCGDDARFEKTLSSYNTAPKEGEIIAVGLYGESLEVTSANYGGWSVFGPKRTITKSEENILFELDGKPALDLYKQYLGDKAKDLPYSALFYPLNVDQHDGSQPLVRTILNIDEASNSMILAGNVPEGSSVQLMMSTVDDIADGAREAAKLAVEIREKKTELALLVSCVGRKLVMDQRTEDEVEEVIDVIGKQAAVTGFYSYGEMAPFASQGACKLHNQTMTLTLLSE